MRSIGLRGALAVSLLLHAGLLWLHWPSPMQPAIDGERTLRIALQERPAPVPPAPRMTTRATPPVPAPSNPPVPPTDWLAQAREIIHADASRMHFQAPPAQNPSERFAVAPAFRVPALATSFKPLPKSLEICGAMVKSGFGIHRREMPVAYACSDKQDEFRNAPAAANRDAATTPTAVEMHERTR